jgi:tetratricopeptide (TPR) repeat protein
MFEDQRGIEFTAASEAAVQAFDKTIEAYLSLSLEAGPRLKAVFEADPDMIMAHCLKGYFFLLMGSGPLIARAQKALEQATASAITASPREQEHVKALGLWCDDRPAAAGIVWEQILADYPRDVLAMRLAHHAHFYAGDGNAMLASLDRTGRDWAEGDAGYGYVLGMRAFANEESGHYDIAETTGRHAVEVEPDNPWAIHAVAHIMEMQDRHREGISWIKAHEPHWVGANNFRYHLWWHRALMHLDQGDSEQALKLYDDVLWDEESDEYLDLCNDVALLSRLEFQGVDVGDRWLPLAEKIKGRTTEHILSFIDAHFAVALMAAGDKVGADELVNTINDKGGDLRRDVGHPLCVAMVAYRSGDHQLASAELQRIEGTIYKVGGSHAQRDLFKQIMIEATIKSGDLTRAREHLEARTKTAPNNALGWQKLAGVLSSMGNAELADDADARSNILLSR